MMELQRGFQMADELIGDDGLPVTSVGAWTLDKHERLVRYVYITHGVRAMFARTQTSYIELFCGPGRSIVEGDGEVIDGSPVRAMLAAQESGVPYVDFHLADFDPASVDAACKRLPRKTERVHLYIGEAERTVDQIVRQLNPHGLHFAFLDPYKLDPLPFSVLRTLARLSRMDMLIHVSIHDFQRNLRRYMAEVDGPLDRFAPGWRDVVDDREIDQKVRIAIFQHWLGLIKTLDMAASEGVEHVVGSKNQPLYWLVLVARHERAHEFWDKIRNVTVQRQFKF
jgi:three-Cys-motif partner protein